MSSGQVLGATARRLAEEMAAKYLRGELILVVGAGVSRSSGLPGWRQMIESIQGEAAASLKLPDAARSLEAVLQSLHGDDPIARADSIRRIAGPAAFSVAVHRALYRDAVPPDDFRPSMSHWHIASLANPSLMPNIVTSNYDDLLEQSKRQLLRGGRVRHPHGLLPQKWNRVKRLGNPPVITSRDYDAAKRTGRYSATVEAVNGRTALLVGMSLSDPQLTSLVKETASDCRALVVATKEGLLEGEQTLRVQLLRQHWQGLGVEVTAVEAYEELPAFLLTLRKAIADLSGTSFTTMAVAAAKETLSYPTSSWAGARLVRNELRAAVRGAKSTVRSVTRDGSLRAGLYLIRDDNRLAHVVSSDSTRTRFEGWTRRALDVSTNKPWGAAGYCYEAGIPIVVEPGGSALDQNVPESTLVAWQAERAAQGRLPALTLLCVPVYSIFRKAAYPIGVAYFSSRNPQAFADRDDDEQLELALRLAAQNLLRPGRSIEG